MTPLELVTEASARYTGGDLDGAARLCRDALRAEPREANALHLLGLIAHRRGDQPAAARLLGEALAIAPRRADAHALLGAVLRARGEFAGAVESFRRACALSEDNPDYLLDLGGSLGTVGRLVEAERCFRRALELRPHDAAALGNLGEALRGRRRYLEAATCYARVLSGRHDDARTRVNLFLCRQAVCEWRGFGDERERVMTLVRERLAAGAPLPLDPWNALLLPFEGSELRDIATRYTREIGARVRGAAAGAAPGRGRLAGRRLRVGYVAAEFRDHATGHLMRGLFASHDRNRFEVYAYSFGTDDGSIYRRDIEAGCDRFVDVAALSPEAMARRIRGDEVEILVDLKGYTLRHRAEVFALRAAPVQVNYLGYPGTMGACFMDYLVGDPVVTPAADAGLYTESLALLPRCYQVNDDRQPIAGPAPPRSACRLPERGVVFACFCASYKIDPEIFDVWMGVLRRVPKSVLWLLRESDGVDENLRREARVRGVEPARLVFAEPLPKPRHLARLALADVCLDTHVYGGHTTTSDALWAGVPVVTSRGRTFASRVSTSLLSAMELPELVAADLQAYERLATVLGGDPERLRAVRERVASRRAAAGGPFDTAAFTRALESLYLQMSERHRAGAPPALLVAA